MSSSSRRHFVLQVVAVGATVAGLDAHAQGAGPKLSESDPQAVALGYKDDTTKVDAKKGWVDVKTSEGSMKLHFPPDTLANVKKGDSVSVELGLKDNGPAAPSSSGKTK